MIKKILEEVKTFPNDKKAMKSFAVVMGAAFVLIYLFLVWRQHAMSWNITFAGLSFFFVVMGLVFPMGLRPIHKAWMTLAVFMGIIVGSILLSILFYFVVTPIALILKVKGKKFFETKGDSSENTYWMKREPLAEMDKAKFEKQY